MTTPTTAQVRAWARAQGYDVADRGRLPGQVLAAYAAAHAEERMPPVDDPLPAPVVAAPLPAPDPDPDGVSGPPADRPDLDVAPGRPSLRARTDGPSRAALLTGVLPPLALVGVVLGIVGLVRTRRSGRPGRGLALAGLFAGTAWLAVLGFFAATYDTTSAPDRSGEGVGVSTAGDVLLEDLEPGDCVLRLPAGAVRALEAVPCATPHRAEVYAVLDVPGRGAYPGDEEVRRVTDGGCDQRAAELALPTVGLRPLSFSPDAETWRLGDREVVCLLEAAEPVTGPLQRGPGAPASG